jgi:hypothetical protein
MMSFLTYITGFVMNFELLPVLTDNRRAQTDTIFKGDNPKFISAKFG